MAAKHSPASLASTIRGLREQADLSQRQLAAMAGVHYSLLSRIESGEVTVPSAETLQRLADTLEIDSSEVLTFIGVKPTLPEPYIYFRKEFGVSEAEANEILRHIEQRYPKKKQT